MPTALVEVHARLPNGDQCRVGDVGFSEPAANGSYTAAFGYAEEWLGRADAFDLDPSRLQRSIGAREVTSKGLRPRLGCLEDALPDAWGRALLHARVSTPRIARDAQLMVATGGGALGALMFAAPGTAPVTPAELAVSDLDELLNAAERFERGEDIPEALLRRLLAAGATPGGARPKALVKDAAGFWLAKFPSKHRDGPMDIVGLEAACLQLAAGAGLRVPEFRLAPLGAGRRALLVRRFDLSLQAQVASNANLGRVHGLSLATLLGETSESGAFSYSMVAETVRKHSIAPRDDVAALYRQMIFNAALGNTDDHLRNFRMQLASAGWRLTPVYDLLPDIERNREHALQFGYSFDCPPRAQALDLARQWSVDDAGRTINEVCAAVREFEAACSARGVPHENTESLRGGIERRLALLE